MGHRRRMIGGLADWLLRVPDSGRLGAERWSIEVPTPPGEVPAPPDDSGPAPPDGVPAPPGDGSDDRVAALPEVAVYVVHWNAPEWCVATVRSFSNSRHVTAVVTVVDNGGLTPGAMARMPGVRVLTTAGNIGYTGGVNIALADWREHLPSVGVGQRAGCPGADVVVVACHDVELHPEALSLMLHAAQQPQVGVVGLHLGSSGAASAPAPPCTLELQARTSISGACMVLRRDCVEAVGRFDERLGSYYEDVDYCLRAGDCGFRVAAALDVRAHWNGQVAEDSSLLAQVNAARLVRYRRGRLGFGLRLLVEVPATLRDGVRWLLPARRAAMNRRLRAHAGVARQLPLLWRRVSDSGLSWRR
jgi:GT2 family glycosyltransferase